jgi:predicted CoA-binding protein
MSLGPTEEINRILGSTKTIAIVGLSEKAGRPSFGVAKYLQKYFTIIPVNPNLTHWEASRAFPQFSVSLQRYR